MDINKGHVKSFEFNYPTIISLLGIASFLVSGLALVGLILAYVWRSDNPDGWESTHYTFHIYTFWISVLGLFFSILLFFGLSIMSRSAGFAVIAMGMMMAIMPWCLIRSIVSLLSAQKQEPIPNPHSWIW